MRRRLRISLRPVNPDNACAPRITDASGTWLAGTYSSSTLRTCSMRKGVYNPKTVILHAMSRRQAFAHCARFLIAASRRSLGRVSVPVWLIILSDQLPVIGLVGFYPTNNLIGRGLVLDRRSFTHIAKAKGTIRYYVTFRRTIPESRGDSHALLSRLPLST